MFKFNLNNFVGNIKSEYYENIVNYMLENYHTLECNMSIKVNFLYSHLNGFLKNLRSISKEQDGKFLQNI
jgi:hypothetical protein